MPDTYRVFRAFIASPGDVAAERQLAEETIGKINRSVRDTIAAEIEVRRWEHLAPVAPDLPEERLQDILDREVEQCHFFILVLYKRYGTVQPGYFISNTEREINTILQVHQKQPKLRILSYFRELEPNVDQGEQEVKVRELRSRLEQLGLPYRTYRDPNEFNQYLTHDLYDVLLRIHLSPFKKQALYRFWQFGETDRPQQPRVAILYPPVERQILAEGGDPEYWLKKLTNQIAFEDYKAIQKIEKGLRLLGFGNYRLYPHTDPPPELPWMNRIWLCLPRNRLGLKALLEHKGVRFKLPVTSGRPQSINWRSKNGRCIQVISPMGEYLRRQRCNMEISGEWHGRLSRIIAKDFAVVARLQRVSATEGEPLWDYFFAGIRGLGTWGSAWFIDREFKQLIQFDKNQNIEILLEVTYRDARILQVTDVSNHVASYFRSENAPATIEKNIRQYQE